MSNAEEPTQCLPPDDVDLIRPLLDEFKSAKRGARKSVVRKAVTLIMAAKDVTHLRPLAQGKLIAEVKEQAKAWLYNHGRRHKLKDGVKYIRRWSIHQVVGALHQKEIEQLCRERSQAVPGETAYLKSYQKVLKAYAEELSEDQQLQYQEMANEWSDRCPPQEVQQRMAEMHSAKYVKQFANVMWRQCGMRLLVLEAHKDTKAELCIASHDFNPQLGGQAFSIVRPGWQTESIMEEWAHYAESQMGPGGEDGDAGALPTTLRRKKAVVEFDRDEDDAPILNDPSQMMARVMEPMVRQFLSIHYNKFSNGKKVAVDWTALSENQDDMIDPKYLPPNFVFRDPSKMKKAHYRALLDHWYGRQEDERISTVFAFKGYWDPSSDSVIVANDEPSARRRPSGRLGHKRKTTAGKARESKNRPGPPGIRVNDKGWTDSKEDEDEQDGDGEDEDEDEGGEEEDDDYDEEEDDDDGRKHHAQVRSPPMDLPFSAKRVVPKSAPKANAKSKKAAGRSARKESTRFQQDAILELRGTSASKSKNSDHVSEAVVAKRRPPSRGLRSGSQAAPISNVPEPVKEKTARKPSLRNLVKPPDSGPQLERPATRSGGKRKADNSGLQDSSNKKAKKGTADKGSRRSKAKSV